MATFTWTGGSSNTWNNLGSWTPSGVPGSTDDAILNDPGGANIVGSGSALDATFTGGHWSYSSGTLSLGQNAAGYGLAVETLLTIGNGGTIVSTVASEGTTPVFRIGYSATGSVTVQSGGRLDSNGSEISVGFSAAATGTLTIQQGGTAVGGGPDGTMNAGLGVGRSGTGTVDVNGGGMTVTGYSYLGRAGTGHLVVENGGTFTSNDAPVGYGGISIGRGTFTNTTVNGTGGTGDALVQTGGLINANDGVFVGGRGVNGTLTINGGRVLANATAGSGNAPVVVGGTVVDSGTTFVGSGTLAIGAAGTLSVVEQNQTLLYGVEIVNNGTGQATVSGNGALLDAGLNGLSVAHGAGSSGTLTIGAGGLVRTGTTNDAQLAGLTVGRQGIGAVNVLSGGSLAVNGNVLIGRAGTGTFTRRVRRQCVAE